MKVLVVLALTWALYPPALPWVAGSIALYYVGDFVVTAVHSHYLQWAADRESRRLARK